MATESNAPRVVVEKLTDGSKVYSVHLLSCEGWRVIIACTTEIGAQNLVTVLRGTAVDVSVPEAA